MITPDIINEVKKRLIDVYNPDAIYLFGSYAWGHPTEDSDLDILIIIKESSEKRHKRGIAGSRALRGMLIPKNILVYTQEELESHAADPTSLCHKVKRARQGVVCQGMKIDLPFSIFI